MDNKETEAERDKRILKSMAEAAKIERDYMKAFTHFVRNQVPELINEMQLLRGALDRHR